jgi:hypothetical protein
MLTLGRMKKMILKMQFKKLIKNSEMISTMLRTMKACMSDTKGGTGAEKVEIEENEDDL